MPGAARPAMTEAEKGEEVETAQVEDLETLRRRASDAACKADAETRSHDRTFWIRYTAIFFPIPFAVLLLRLHMQAWHYYGRRCVVLGSNARDLRDGPCCAGEA